MSAPAPELDRAAFAALLARHSPVELSSDAVARLWIHYVELLRWNRRLSLIGPGTVDDVIARHYGESLAALELLDAADRRLVDIGSGAGFPGFVLAAARPDLDVVLVEAREKKWSFLSLVSEKSALPCRCLNARVTAALAADLPQKMDVISTRAVKLSGAEVTALAGRLSSRGRFLLWCGAEVPASLSALRRGRSVALRGSQRRRILELFPEAS